MEKRKRTMGDWDQKALASELTLGKELTKQLVIHLQHSSSQEEKDFLISKILFSYEKVLSVLTKDAASGGESKQIQDSMLGSPCSFGNSSSPLSEISDQDCKNKNVFKKRKTLPKRTEEVKVCSGTGQDGSLDDGFSWRKYGQKDILGANFPRGYYRCTHRNTQGCTATKKVQKSDADPAIFVVTYSGVHTCHQASQTKGNQNSCVKQEARTPKQSPEKSISFGESLRVETEGLDSREGKNEIFPSFSFPSTPIQYDNNVVGEDVFSAIDTNFMGGSYSPTFASPMSGFESDYFGALSPCRFALGNDVQTPESDLTNEIISAPTSVTNSPIGDFGFSLDDLDFYKFGNNPECNFS